ncbi:acyl-CoA reductase-like NAD-dependent aldehyde dehydrogenase [Naumannella cuiyingiana]|uniref:Acyl-CoA reductase-like NAD-dependent aldehyde dehydrogenase n=1 Tax=Naumannella cuiyingiana TaxID=1347891 RepID=A0A7Z0ILQ4_9ACTN|nr:aldehyde dehydrogenase family protein [Naumannella cuiyingiana]NYI71855.1 acyl-CoA reductase-like NAD-dependent aldehyde dehydrogenase [Naumannella cuiyingiana]
MIEQRWPDGLPIGEDWQRVPGSEEVIFPHDGSVIGTAPVGDQAVAARAVDHAAALADVVGALPSRIRRGALQRALAELRGQRAELEQLLVAETGKPLIDCRVEVDRALLTLELSAEEVARLHGETVPLDLLPSGDGLIGFWQRRPIGVVVGIAGFNYPFLLAMHKIAPALAAGCPVIVKPAPQTPLATLWLVDVLRRALVAEGAPAGAVQLVTGDAAVGRALTTDPRVGAVSFTGSAAVGHAIARDAAPTKVLLELGSNAALVVAADADLAAAADAVIRGGYYASGQACISVQRVIVVEEVREAFLAELAPRLAEVVVGDPRDPKTRVAALIDERSTRRVRDWLAAAQAAGGEIIAGGRLVGGAIEPTVLVDPPVVTEAWAEEIFGPVVAVRSVPDLAAAIDLVNDSRYGLHVAIFTASLAAAFAAVERIEAGGVVVNEVPGFRSDVMPYGGVKDSGAGREGPRFAIEELTVTRMAIIRPDTRAGA